MRLTNINNINNNKFTVGLPTKEITINSPIPTALGWHKETNWKYAKELYINDIAAWNKIKGHAPLEVIQKVEG